MTNPKLIFIHFHILQKSPSGTSAENKKIPTVYSLSMRLASEGQGRCPSQNFEVIRTRFQRNLSVTKSRPTIRHLNKTSTDFRRPTIGCRYSRDSCPTNSSLRQFTNLLHYSSGAASTTPYKVTVSLAGRPIQYSLPIIKHLAFGVSALSHRSYAESSF